MDASDAPAGTAERGFPALLRRERILEALRGRPLALLGSLLVGLDDRRQARGRPMLAEMRGLPWRVRQTLRKLQTEAIVLYQGRAEPASASLRRRAILVSHDLSASGAPRVVFEIARDLRAQGLEVLVFSRRDGPFRAELQAVGVHVVVQDALLERPTVFSRLSACADRVVLNTAVSAPLAASVVRDTPAYVYLHEISSLRKALKQGCGGLREGLTAARAVWAGNTDTADVVRDFRPDVSVFPYGVSPSGLEAWRDRSEPLIFRVFGSYETRKGQDLALEAARSVAARRGDEFVVKMNGRVLDWGLFHALETKAQAKPFVQLGGELDYSAYLDAMAACDVVLVSSRDDTLPLVSLDALGGGRVLLCTATTGTAAYIQDGVNGFVADRPTASSLAAAMERVLDRRRDLSAIAQAGRAVFDGHFSREAFSERLTVALGLEAVVKGAQLD